MDRVTVAKLLQRALDYAVSHQGENACRNGLCMTAEHMRARGYFTKEERDALHAVIEELLDEWRRGCGLPDKGFAYLWVGILRRRGIPPATEQIFPIWRQVYEDKIKELETGVHHG